MLTGGGGGGKASLTLAKNVRFSRLCIGIIIDLTQQVSTHHVSKNIKIRITSAVWCLDNPDVCKGKGGMLLQKKC